MHRFTRIDQRPDSKDDEVDRGQVRAEVGATGERLLTDS
jgi:hypothetical protein